MKLYVPIMNGSINENNRKIYLEKLKTVQADNVFLAIDRFVLFKKDNSAYLNALAENIRFFEGNGFSVGVWFQAFGFGDKLNDEASEASREYTYLKSVTGKERVGYDAFCPLNKNFTRDFCKLVYDVASVGAKAIMLDDDLCLSVRPGIGCFCDEHLKLLYNAVGEKPPFEELKRLIFTGGKNKYRTAWLNVMRDTLADFCAAVRSAVDKANKNCRVGLCAGYTSWDIEGAPSTLLAEILAGDTLPFLRLTGAPYWVCKDVNRFGGQRLGTVIECARAQEKWCRDTGIEIFCEADSYPRPRYHVPSAYIECFDLALRASGNMGILKYMLDYYSSPSYENGYIRAHMKNRALYEFIQKHFTGKKSCGVAAIEKMRRIENAPLGDTFSDERSIMARFFSPACALLTAHGIPVTYEESDCAAVFGDNALYTDVLPKKLIIDISAAQILKERGFDIGIEISNTVPVPRFEHFGGERVNLYNLCGKYFKCEPHGSSETLSFFESSDGRLYPACIRARINDSNALIYTFDAYTENQSSDVFLSYERQAQLLDFAKGYPYIKGFPGVYQIFKKDESGAAVLFLNIFEDEIPACDIILDMPYSAAEFCGGSGTLHKNRIKLSTPIPPFGALAISLTY